jgi:hypothetical protein
MQSGVHGGAFLSVHRRLHSCRDQASHCLWSRISLHPTILPLEALADASEAAIPEILTVAHHPDVWDLSLPPAVPPRQQESVGGPTIRCRQTAKRVRSSLSENLDRESHVAPHYLVRVQHLDNPVVRTQLINIAKAGVRD